MSAEKYLPPRLSLKGLRAAAEGCRGCDLYKDASQTVFGEGKKSSRMVLVGETPGDVEDREGHVFVGPAGHELDRALEHIGIDRGEVYLTNAVKHFRFEQRGRLLDSDLAPIVVATIHPSAVLRAPDDRARIRERKAFTRDLQVAADALARY